MADPRSGTGITAENSAIPVPEREKEAGGERVGVLVMAHGTPASGDEIEAYYTRIRRGRPPSVEQLDDLRRRYDAIGGTSPLAEHTRAQAAGIEAALGASFRAYLGQKHAAPFIEDGVAAMAGDGVTRCVGIVLAPHYSALSVQEYLDRAAAACAAQGIEAAFVRDWHLEPGLVAVLADRLERTVSSLPYQMADAVHVLVTAHSLPARVLDMGDPYPQQVGETAAAITQRAGSTRWSVAWQSAGRTSEPWLGPDLLDVLRDLGAAGDVRAVVVCPAGFTADHLEVLYDVDIEAAAVAQSCGLALARTPSLNDDPALCHTLAAVVRRHVPA